MPLIGLFEMKKSTIGYIVMGALAFMYTLVAEYLAVFHSPVYPTEDMGLHALSIGDGFAGMWMPLLAGFSVFYAWRRFCSKNFKQHRLSGARSGTVDNRIYQAASDLNALQRLSESDRVFFKGVIIVGAVLIFNLCAVFSGLSAGYILGWR